MEHDNQTSGGAGAGKLPDRSVNATVPVSESDVSFRSLSQDNETIRRGPGQFGDTLGGRLLESLAGSLSNLWGGSHSVFTLDVSRPKRWEGPNETQQHENARRRPPKSQFQTSSDRNRNDPVHDDFRPDGHWIQGIKSGGARAKIMQIWDFPDKETGQPNLPWGLNFGVGAALDMERSSLLNFKIRLRSKHATLHILPSPYLELQGKFPLGNIPIGVSVNYRLPLDDLENFWVSPAAHFRVNIYNLPGTGFHISPGGLEFDEQVLKLGKYTTLRVAASVLFPRTIPPEEGDQPFKIKVHRFGLKTRML
eukprot:TRINITY_DN38173_c0_g1_i1.p1 TRINITY_DN38173_c0_g1~~TRINITY_DN38173_c0_g1_i1.p1  ORF type:complete len:308 (+),score=36.24 TRINITY_DN38173_c0_g1_i1:186-1109(+)